MAGISHEIEVKKLAARMPHLVAPIRGNRHDSKKFNRGTARELCCSMGNASCDFDHWPPDPVGNTKSGNGVLSANAQPVKYLKERRK